MTRRRRKNGNDDRCGDINDYDQQNDDDGQPPRRRISSSASASAGSAVASSISSTARRAQLTVKHSIIGNLLLSPKPLLSPSTVVSSSTTSRRRTTSDGVDDRGRRLRRASRDDDDDDDPPTTNNIDEAMRSLYCEDAAGLVEGNSNTGFGGRRRSFSNSISSIGSSIGTNQTNNNNNSSLLQHCESSFVLDEKDWVLDGCQEWDDDAEQSKVVLQQLNEYSDSDNLEHIVMRHILEHKQQQLQQKEEEGAASASDMSQSSSGHDRVDVDENEFDFECDFDGVDDDDDDDDDDMEFGDFQSAEPEPSPSPPALPLPAEADADADADADAANNEREGGELGETSYREEQHDETASSEADDDDDQEQEETSYSEEKKQEEECCGSSSSSAAAANDDNDDDDDDEEEEEEEEDNKKMEGGEKEPYGGGTSTENEAEITIMIESTRSKALLDSDEEETPKQEQEAIDEDEDETMITTTKIPPSSSDTSAAAVAAAAAAVDHDSQDDDDDVSSSSSSSTTPITTTIASPESDVSVSSVTTAENRCEQVRLSIERLLDTNLTDFEQQQQQQDAVVLAASDTPESLLLLETPAVATVRTRIRGAEDEGAGSDDVVCRNLMVDKLGGSLDGDDDEEEDSAEAALSLDATAVEALLKNRLLPDEGTPKISLVLPIEDLSSLEARFARRLQLLHNQQKEEEQKLGGGGNDDSDHDNNNNNNSSPRRSRSVAPLHKVDQAGSTDIDDLGLPSYYFAHDFDDTVRVLESLPWRCLPDYYCPTPPRGAAASGGGGDPNSTAGRHHRRSSSDALYESSESELWEESMVTKLCDLDAALECVNAHILHRIQPHERRIQNVNNIAHEWEQNLRLAFMYWDRSWQALEEAAGAATAAGDNGEEEQDNEASGLLGPSVLLEAWDHRDDYIALQDALNELAIVLEKEQDLFQRIDNFDIRESDALNEYHAVSKLSNELEETVRNGRLSSLDCLNELRDRLSTTGIRFWERLLALSESVVVRSCRRKSSSCNWMVEYERLVKAVVDLHSSDAFEAVTNHHFVVDAAMDWSRSILDALCHEADRALASALLEPTENDGEQSSPSEYERELAHYAYEFNCGWGDDAKLRTLVQNLVTIRFCFESSSDNSNTNSNYLPRVFHKLLAGLADVLHAHYLFTQWHSVPFDDRCRNFEALHGATEASDCSSNNSELLASIRSNLIESRAALWRHCEAVIVKCLSEYLDFTNRPKLFQTGEDGRVDDSAWQQDLHGLHQVLCLSDQFLFLEGPFFGDDKLSSCGISTLKEEIENDLRASLYENLGLVFRKHLRSVHVEAMEAMGRMLANESWILTRSAFENQNLESSCLNVGSLLLGAFRSFSKIKGVTPTRVSEVSSDQEIANTFALYPKRGNPFGTTIRTCTTKQEAPSSSRMLTGEMHSQSEEAREYIHQVLSAPAADNRDDHRSLLAPTCVSNGLIEWFSRLVDITTLLPPIVEDVSAVFADVCDLFFTTALRLCTGCSKNEKILLGVEPPSPFVVLRNDSTSKTPRNAARDARSPIFSSFRKSMSKATNRRASRPPSFLPAALDAEICSPLLRDVASVSRLSAFIMRAQDSLRDVVSLDKVDSWLVDPVRTTETLEEHVCGVARLLEKRQGAIWSCFVVAALADVALSEAKTRLSSTFLGSDYEEDLLPLTAYVRVMLEITPDFAALACRFSCVRAIGGYDVVKSVLRVGAGWEECKLHEHANEYVDELGDRCALIWGFLCVSAKLPFVVRKTIWCQLCSGAYLSLLEGFARVPFCSTEGRALMTLDLASFSIGLSSASITDRLEELALVSSPPPPVNPERSEGYVDTYIKVFYYPMEDVMTWIEENYRDYQLGHSIALVTGATASLHGSSEKDLSEMVEQIMQLYGRSENGKSAAIS